MGRVKVVINQDGLRAMMREAALNIDKADAAFRETHTGYPVHVVRADAPDALPLEMTDEGWDAYATAVAAGDPFEFKLVG